MRDSDMVADFQFADEIRPPRLYWLWPGRIPLGRLTLLVGDPGLGKTLLMADLAARVSVGLPWPDDPPLQSDKIEYCPEPLLEGQPDGCPLLFRDIIPAPADLGPTTIENPDGTALQLPGPQQPPDLPSASDPADAQCSARARICPNAKTADLFDCPYRLRPGSPEPLEHIFRRRRPAAPLGVLFICPEDRDSLTPRLVAAGADLNRICILNGVSPRNHSARAIAPLKARYPHDATLDREIIVEPLRLPAHADVIVEALNFFDHAGLVIIDPLQSVLPAAGQGGPDGLAAALGALAEVARERGVAIVGICHLAKSRYLQTLYRVQGSVSLMGAARAAHMLSVDSIERDRRILVPIKTVYGRPPAEIAFHIVSPGKLEWEPPRSPAEGGARYLTSEVLNATPETHSAVVEACDWLAAYLAAGPQPFRQIQRDAFAAGISLSTLRRAKRLMAVRSIELPNHAGWVWSADEVRNEKSEVRSKESEAG